jgi:scyllo-inositol 2-dehydrogenase (NADP+)
MDDLRVAIIGYGLAGSVFHAPLIDSTSGLAVTSVVTGNPERAESARRAHPAAQVLPNVEELWARAPEHDLVVVAAANNAHVPLAAQALESGLAVIVDKPMAPSPEAALSLIKRAEERDLMLTPFHNRRWDSDQLTLRRLLGEGELGEVFRYESRFERWVPELGNKPWRDRAPAAEGGGILLDLGTHLVDQALVLFGPVERVYAEVAARRDPVADDDAFLDLTHRSGVRSHLIVSALTGAPGPRLTVLGTGGAYVVAELDGQEDRLRAGERPGKGEWGTEPLERWGVLARGEERAPVPSEPGNWPAFYAGVVSALRDGAPPPVDPRDAVAVLEVLAVARGSSEEGVAINL